jgi:prolyl oligopeptidase
MKIIGLNLKNIISSVLFSISSYLVSGTMSQAMPKDTQDLTDPYLYLEEVEGEKALQWVKDQNDRTELRLAQDPRLNEIEAVFLQSLKNPKRIAYPSFSDGNKIDNFWIDDVHERGQWRRTSWTQYSKGDSRWDILLDVDALAKQEGRNWVFQGAYCLPSDRNRCLISLSDGGGDSAIIREYDVKAKRFVEDGFELPAAKQDVSWVDKDTLYVSREWAPGEVTDSGYAYVTKRLKRGQTLNQAVEIFRGEKSDISAGRRILRDIDNKYIMDMNVRVIADDNIDTTFLSENNAVTLALPPSSAMKAYKAGHLIYQLKEDWVSAGGKKFNTDSLISFELSKALENPQKIEPVLVFAPSSNQSVEGIDETKNYLIIHTLTNVMGELHTFILKDGAWHSQKIPLADNMSVSVISADDNSDDLFITTESLLEPAHLYRVNAASLELRHLASEVRKFASDDLQVQQNWATSKDDTKIPYFIVSKKNISLDGSNPTLLRAYGGFEVSSTPSYLGNTGKIWLEKGGVYVLANIRGGGEFGKKWHEAGLKTKRQVVFDDFQAVAEDLIERKITSPRKLGIQGGSNGGLLMGVQLTQRPELWGAVLIDVPLLDMVRYNRLLAGASWMSEYGDPEDPVEGAFLRSISPYHNLKAEIVYPEPFFNTTTLDDRVHPAHARKMAAKMQSLNIPFLFYENKDGGHGNAATAVGSVKIEAMKYVYLFQKLMN